MAQSAEPLPAVLQRHYGHQVRDPDRLRYIEALVRARNPRLGERVYGGQLVALPVLPPNLVCTADDPADDWAARQDTAQHVFTALEQIERHLPTDPIEREAFWALAQLQEHYDWLSLPGAVGLGTLGHLVGPGNRSLVLEVGQLYQRYQAGALTKGQYDYRRAKLLRQLAEHLGPTERFLFKGRTVHQAIRIQRHRSLPATQRISRHAHRLSRLANLTKYGGIVLGGVGAAAACGRIGATASRQEKNEILVETLGGTLVSGAVGLAVGAVMIGTPVGWGLALVLAAGTAGAGVAGGWGARTYYNRKLREVDFVEEWGVDQLCQ